MRSLRQVAIFYGLMIATFLLDLGSKWWAVHCLTFAEPVALLPGLNLYLAHNPGAAFSMLNQGGWQAGLLLAIAALLVSYLLWRLHRPQTKMLESIALSLIIGGAIGNALNRLLLGYVIDFIDVYVKDYHWPTFNLADSAICLGVGLLVINMVRKNNFNGIG